MPKLLLVVESAGPLSAAEIASVLARGHPPVAAREPTAAEVGELADRVVFRVDNETGGKTCEFVHDCVDAKGTVTLRTGSYGVDFRLDGRGLGTFDLYPTTKGQCNRVVVDHPDEFAEPAAFVTPLPGGRLSVSLSEDADEETGAVADLPATSDRVFVFGPEAADTSDLSPASAPGPDPKTP